MPMYVCDMTTKVNYFGMKMATKATMLILSKYLPLNLTDVMQQPSFIQ